MSISRWIDNTAVVYILNEILLSPKKNAFESVLKRWMKLESEVSQKEKHQYSILTLYMEFRKMVTITLYGREQKRHRCIEQCFALCGRRWGWEDLREYHWNIHEISYVKQITRPGSMHETGCSGMVHWDDPEGWDGEGGGRGAQDGEHMYTHGWFMWIYDKNHHNIVK